MGCICSKGASLNEYSENSKGSRKGRSRKVEVEIDRIGNDANARLIPNQLREDNIGFTPISPFDGERKTLFSRKSAKQNLQRGASIGCQASGGQAQFRSPGSFLGTLAGEKGSQVVTGWPTWLTAVAAEAISGWVPRQADSFEKLDKIGQGTYSSVYRARDLETSKIVALKKVRFANMDPESVRFMAREITILRRLDHPNVMKLEGLISSRTSKSLYLVFEYMEHDLAGLASTPGMKMSEAQIKCYMQQLLHGLEHCHRRGVLHRDIKGSNLLIDNNGTLKIGDFGLSTFLGHQQKQKSLTSRVVTLWYRPPELLLGATDYGVGVDLWSAGCVLAELFAGKPIMSGRTEVEQLHKIFKLCGSPSEEYWKKSKLPNATIFKPQQPYKRCFGDTYKDFPSSTLKLLDTLLAVEPDCRGTASSALQSKFFTTEPLPCDPSSLPKYPPSKEIDTKIQEEDVKRRKAAGGKGCRHESMSKFLRDSNAVPAIGANAELLASVKHNPSDAGSRFPVKGMASARNGEELRTQRSYMDPGAAHLSMFSNSVAVRGFNNFEDESFTKQDQKNYLLNGQQNTSSKDEQLSEKDSMTGYVKMNQIHYSGPLVPPGGNMDEMLKEHEKQIQNAVRKARQAKKTYCENEQTESLLQDAKNGRLEPPTT